MLYDPKWEKKVETKINPLSWEAVIAWLERQPADRVYCYRSTGNCLAAQYNKSIGRKYHIPAATYDGHGSFDQQFEGVACGSPRTFGAALERARAALASYDGRMMMP